VEEDEKEDGEKEKNGRARGNLGQDYCTLAPSFLFFPSSFFLVDFYSLIQLPPLILRDARKAVCVPTTVIRSSVARMG
jgi:hypothetical protein